LFVEPFGHFTEHWRMSGCSSVLSRWSSTNMSHLFQQYGKIFVTLFVARDIIHINNESHTITKAFNVSFTEAGTTPQ
jgi:hypothetical protein